jgi:hypothetical protein
MAKKKRSILEWLLDQGVGPAYTVLFALVLALFKWSLIGMLFLIAWWEHIR